MRSLRLLHDRSGALGLVAGPAMGQANPKGLPSPSALLKLRPKLQGVEYDTPPDQAAVNACKVESVVNDQKRSVGYALRDAQGKLLRRFVIARGGRKLDQWSYYQDGFEVYREEDLDGDRSLDECRWLNAGGHADRADREGPDQGMEADLGRRGVEGAGSGARAA